MNTLLVLWRIASGRYGVLQVEVWGPFHPQVQESVAHLAPTLLRHQEGQQPSGPQRQESQAAGMPHFHQTEQWKLVGQGSLDSSVMVLAQRWCNLKELEPHMGILANDLGREKSGTPSLHRAGHYKQHRRQVLPVEQALEQAWREPAPQKLFPSSSSRPWRRKTKWDIMGLGNTADLIFAGQEGQNYSPQKASGLMPERHTRKNPPASWRVLWMFFWYIFSSAKLRLMFLFDGFFGLAAPTPLPLHVYVYIYIWICLCICMYTCVCMYVCLCICKICMQPPSQPHIQPASQSQPSHPPHQPQQVKYISLRFGQPQPAEPTT